ncbi:MAG: DHHW family protein [Saccharofermentanales bacterium]|jgi:hypothetical protein
MRTRTRNQIITIYTFVIFLLAVGFLHIILPSKEISEDEGRKLRTFPKLNLEDARTGQQAANIEGWFSDQFPFRPTLITIGKNWRSLAFPNLNPDGLQITPISHDLAVAEDPDNDPDVELDNPGAQSPTPDETELHGEPGQSNLEQPNTDVSVSPTPEATDPPVEEPPPLDEGEFKKTKVGIVITNDRAMEMYYGNEKKLKAYADRLNKLDSILPQTTQVFSLVVPTAIELYAPDQYHSGYSSQKDCIGIINDSLASGIKSINAYDRLLNNRDKYIYFRTDHHWTGLGAYYAYVAFCETAGWNAVPLEKMEHYKLEGTYLGSLYRATKEQALKNNPDTTEGWKPVVGEYTATAWDSGKMDKSYQIKLNNPKVNGSNSYLNYSGGDRALLKIATSHSSGRKILVIKDSFGNAFVPYLVNHYDEVYVVDTRYYERSLQALVKDNGITDVMVLNYMFGTSNATWLKGFDKINK